MNMTAVDGVVTPLGWRRAAATAVDYAIVVGYVLVLLAVGLSLRAAGFAPAITDTPRRVLAQLVASGLLSIPVTLWLAAQEATRQATIGKRRLGLVVVARDGGRLGWARALGRAVGKVLLPWELAHTAIWDLALHRDNPLDAVLLGLVYAIVAGYGVSLFVGSGRAPYDRLVGAVVIRATAAAGRPHAGACRRPPARQDKG